jgi:hypothetical protein
MRPADMCGDCPKSNSSRVFILGSLAEQLANRGIPRHYGPEELTEDLSYARGE